MLRRSIPLLSPAEAPTAAPPANPRAGIGSFVDRLNADDAPPAPAAAAAPAAPAAPPEPPEAPEPPATAPKAPDAPKPAAVAPTPKRDWDKQAPKNAKEWEQAKTAIRGEYEPKITEFQGRVTELETQLTEREKELEIARTAGSAEDKALAERLKKENDQLSETVRQLEVTQHPKFKAYFDNKVGAQMTLAKNIVGADKAEEATRLLSMPDSEFRQAKIDEFVGDLSPIQQSRFGAVLNSLEQVAIERDEAVKTETARASELREKQTTDLKTRQDNARKQAETAFATTLKTLQDPANGNPAYQLREGDEDWNKNVQERIGYAKKLLTGDGLKPEAFIKATFDAASLPAILQYTKTLAEENTTLKAQVEKLTKAQPGLSAGGGDGAGKGARQGVKPGTAPSSARDNFFKKLTETE